MQGMWQKTAIRKYLSKEAYSLWILSVFVRQIKFWGKIANFFLQQWRQKYSFFFK